MPIKSFHAHESYKGKSSHDSNLNLQLKQHKIHNLRRYWCRQQIFVHPMPHLNIFEKTDISIIKVIQKK